MNYLENKDTVNADGGVPPKEEEEDDDDVAAVDTDDTATQEKKKKQQQQQYQRQQQQRKRHGARNQHKMKHFVRWLLETFPDILVQPSPTTAQNPGNKMNISCNANNTMSSSCNHDAKQQTEQNEEEQDLKVEPSRTRTKSSSSSGASEFDDEMIHPNDDSTVAPPLPPPLILDVAGGKGELAARLCLCLHGIRVVLVDPRGPVNIAQTYQQTVVPRLPKKWQERLQQRLITNPNHVHDLLKTNFDQVMDYFSYQNAVTTVVSNNDKNDDDDDDEKNHQQQEVRLRLRLQQAVQDASLLIGMHADGATEDIIDVALHYQKPFVVVPCCVFANLYSHRQVRTSSSSAVVRDGNKTNTTTNTNEEKQGPPPPKPPVMAFASVRTHEQFCQYLLDKDARFQKSILPFKGRNVAIWWNGK
jgi:hypothetical protein